MTDTLDTLAGLRVLAGRGEPVRRKLDADGVGVLVTLPDPEYLARTLEPLGSDLRRSGSRIVSADGSPAPGWSVQEVAARLVDSWAALPDRTDAGPVYRDLRIVSTTSPAIAADYALQVVRSARDLLEPAPRAGRAPGRPRTGSSSAAERKRASREQQRRDEEESVRWFLAGWTAGRFSRAAPAPGMRVPAPALRRKADREISTAVAEYDETLSPVPPGGEPEQTGGTDADLRALRAYEEQRRERGDFSDRWESWEEYADEWDLPLRPRVPRRSVFFSLADEVLGKRSTYRGQQVYTIPDTRGGTMPNTITREEISEALEVREIVAALREHKRRHSSRHDSGGRFAPAADGTVVPLDSRRR